MQQHCERDKFVCLTTDAWRTSNAPPLLKFNPDAKPELTDVEFDAFLIACDKIDAICVDKKTDVDLTVEDVNTFLRVWHNTADNHIANGWATRCHETILRDRRNDYLFK